MSKTGGKGRISNELVAASCAAVLTVYGAGYWRTRDAARQMERQALERRAPRPVPPVQPVAIPEDAATEAVADEIANPPAAPEAPALIEKPAQKVEKVATAKPPPPPAPAPPANTPPAAEPAAPVESSEPTLAKALAAGANTPPSAQWRDGVYTGWGTSNHGDIEARVVIQGGRIVDSGISSCETRYPCDVIYMLLFQPVERQRADVDGVSRATESADAYYYGLQSALNKALETPSAPDSTPQ